MAIDKRLGKKIPKHFVKEESYQRLDPGPFIGKIKNNLDSTRSGRLQVYIPDLASGDESNEDNWRTVQYASPFLGTTTQPDTNKLNSFNKVQHSYGMWFIPPDIGNLVICTFIGGDPNRGFWFACVPNQVGHHMIPGIGGSHKVDDSSIGDKKVASGYTKGKPTVVSEINENSDDINWADFVNLKKPIHEEQFKVYLEQGLEEDYVRGIVSSTSQRESPSYVFGISTPGRPVKDPSTDPKYTSKVQSGNLQESDYAVSARKGGHVFLMDDGNFQNKDKLMRLRTAGGHQILMNDSEHILYIGNDTGSVWIELTGPGHLNIYTGKNVNIRAEGDLNFHADKNIKFNAGQDIQMSASKNFNLQSSVITVNSKDSMTVFGGTSLNLGSDSSVNLNAGSVVNALGSSAVNIVGGVVKLNEGFSSSAVFSKPAPLVFNNLPDTGKKKDKWVSVDNALPTIVSVAPTHEPWKLHQQTTMPGIFATAASTSVSQTNKTTNTQTGSTFTPTNLASATEVTGVAAAQTETVDETSGDGITSGLPPSKTIPTDTVESVDLGPVAAAKVGLKNPADPSIMTSPTTYQSLEGIGILNPKQTTGLKAQLAKNESDNNYKAETSTWLLGKYKFTAQALADQGYLKRDAVVFQGNKAINMSSNWTDKDSINSKEDFKNSPAIQEKVVDQLLKINYKILVRIGGIKDNDGPRTQAGMLSVAHLLGPEDAKLWRETDNVHEARQYYNIGSYGVEVLGSA